jgi:hypothetical protein
MKSLVEIILQLINKPSVPNPGYIKIYPKADKNLHMLDSDGVESKVAKYSDTQNLIDSNIAPGAAIQESKLALTYPTEWLKNYADSLYGAGYQEVIVGDGVKTSWNIKHELERKYVNVRFYLGTTDKEVEMNNQPVDNNNILVSGVALLPGEQVRVVVE